MELDAASDVPDVASVESVTPGFEGTCLRLRVRSNDQYGGGFGE